MTAQTAKSEKSRSVVFTKMLLLLLYSMYLSRVIRNLLFEYICENKYADQLRSNKLQDVGPG